MQGICMRVWCVFVTQQRDCDIVRLYYTTTHLRIFSLPLFRQIVCTYVVWRRETLYRYIWYIDIRMYVGTLHWAVNTQMARAKTHVYLYV